MCIDGVMVQGETETVRLMVACEGSKDAAEAMQRAWWDVTAYTWTRAV